MNLWTVYHKDDDDDPPFAVAAWSHGADEARQLWSEQAVAEFGDCGCDENCIVCLPADRSRLRDVTPVGGLPCLEWRDNVLRRAGWRYEGDQYCHECETSVEPHEWCDDHYCCLDCCLCVYDESGTGHEE